MQYTAFIIFFVTLTAKSCSAGLSIESLKLNGSIIEASIEILESCYADSGTVGIAGPSAGSIVKWLSLRKTVIPTVWIDVTSKSVSQKRVNDSSRYRLQVFVITFSDPRSLTKTIERVRDSKWWNHMGSFLLISLPKPENGCSDVARALEIAWQFNLIKSKCICLHQTRGRLIYNFNPYTSYALSPWQREGTYEGINDHDWTLFVRNYDKNESRCDKLDFDKTVDVGKYEIRATFVGVRTIEPEAGNTDAQKLLAQLLMSSLNATWRVNVYDISFLSSDDEMTEVNVNISRDIDEGKSDINLNTLPMVVEVNGSFRWIYPIQQVERHILTMYQGHMSPLEKLVSVLDRSSRFGVLVVLTITLLFFKFWLRQPLIPATLNLVLLICNAAIRGIPREAAPRVYLASLFVLVVTIQGIYSGKLASLLTKKVRLPTVDSLEDLARSDHTIYVDEIGRPTFNHSAFEGRDIRTLFVNNSLEALHNPKCAVVFPKDELISMAAELSSHLSRESIGHDSFTFTIRDDWPLEERVNTVFLRLAASGIPNLLFDRAFRTELRNLTSVELEDREPELKPLSLEHLGFAFKILAIGLGLATMVFIVEVATKDWD